MLTISRRSAEPEILDDFQLKGHDLAHNLQELEKVNRYLGGHNSLRKAISEVVENDPRHTIRLLDAGCGGGDALRMLALWLRKRKKDFQLTGFDANANAIEYAIRHSTGYPNLRFRLLDIKSESFRRLPADVVTFNLFLHHFSEPEIVSLLVTCRHKKCAIVINDLERSWLAYHLFRIVSRLMGFSYISRYDGKLSVKKSFSRKDWQRIFAKAGIDNYQIRRRWAFRWLCIIPKPPELAD